MKRRTEKEIRAKIAELEERIQHVSFTGASILSIRIETLRWTLGEETMT